VLLCAQVRAAVAPIVSLPPTEQSSLPHLEQTRWFAAEVQPHDSSLRAYLHGTFPSVGDVDDVVQESYLRVWKTRAGHPIHSAKAFLFTVAKRIALNIVRKKGNAPFVPLGDLSALRVLEDKPNAADALCEQEKIDLLADAVMTLPARCREIIILHKLQALPQKEVAARLGLAEKTVESQTRIGVKRCLEFLQQHGITDFYGHAD
jgi:RNA polymerase sigma-70 factor (ECF subfamily)